jgi:DNA-binding CsgD family transcriptional regulator
MNKDRPVEEWIVNAGLRLSRMDRVDRYDCEHIVRIRIDEGRSRRLAWLESRREIEAHYLPSRICDESSFSALQSHGSADIELVTRVSDLRLILSAEEFDIAGRRIEGHSLDEIGNMLGLKKACISRKLKEIRRKILAYYAS